MAGYILKRMLQAIPLLFIITVLCFGLIQLAPYDAVDAMTTPNMSKETVENIKETYGLNKPAYEQYIHWIAGVFRGELGYSIVTHQNIGESLLARIPNTIILVLPAYALALMLAVVLGLAAGLHRGKKLDRIIDGFCSIGIAIPSFWLALILIYVFGYQLRLLPIMGIGTTGEVPSVQDLLKHMVLPVTVLTLAFLPELIRYVRSSAIGELSEDYVMVQRAYGASDIQILFHHVLRNALLPIITIIGMSLPILVTGAVVTETVFGWPGIGPYFVKAIQGFDYPVVMAVMLLSASLVIIGNLLSDILYGLVDPRIRNMGEQE